MTVGTYPGQRYLFTFSGNGEAGEDVPDAMDGCSPLQQPISIPREMLEKHGTSAVNFRGEALTFKVCVLA